MMVVYTIRKSREGISAQPPTEFPCRIHAESDVNIHKEFRSEEVLEDLKTRFRESFRILALPAFSPFKPGK